jgi:hypothetical protein
VAGDVIARRCCSGAVLRAMNDDRRTERSRSKLSLVLRDVHFWVPVIVLIGGLLVLRWIH